MSVLSNQGKDIAVNAADKSIVCTTQPSSIFRHGIQHLLNIRRRAGNDTQDFTGGRLLLQRFGEFLKQAHVLDCDNCLVGEGFEQLDLSLGERTNFPSTNMNRADGFAFAEQRRHERSSNSQGYSAWLQENRSPLPRGHGYGSSLDPPSHDQPAYRG